MPDGFCTFRIADRIIIQFDLPAGWCDAALASSTLSPSHPNLLPLARGPTFEIINFLNRSTPTIFQTSGANLAGCDGNFFTIDFPAA
jgi:hypothetical protein